MSSVFNCEECEFSTKKGFLLKRHLTTHREDRQFQCSDCPKRFKTKTSQLNHQRTHFGIKPNVCPFCYARFTTSGELVRHKRYIHTGEKPHQCQLCDYSSVELSKLRRHIRAHTGERPFQCPHCSYASADTFKLKRHLRIHTGEKPYQCQTCGKSFAQSNSLKAHSKIHTNDKDVFPCQLCDSTFGRQNDLNFHLQKLHSSGDYFCPCGKQLADRYSLKIHKRSHQGEKYLQCSHCDYRASSRKHLETHYLIHTGQKPFICPVKECGKTFRQKQLLTRHHRMYHEPHIQQQPPKEKTLQCSECDKRFRHGGNLTRHLLKIHGIEKERDRSFVCDLCPQSFPSIYRLKIHKKIHYDVEELLLIEEPSNKLNTVKKFENQKEVATYIRETKRSRKNMIRLKAQIEEVIAWDEDDIQIWEGEEYVCVPQTVDTTLLLWGNDSEIVDITTLFLDPSFGSLDYPESSSEMRRSVGFQGRNTSFLYSSITSLLNSVSG